LQSDPTILAFDTSAAHCAAALLKGGRIVSSCSEALSRGQAERLMPLLEELLKETNQNWQDLDAIGVGTGPGNFTGIRISVSAARGLALGLSIPAVGINGFDALDLIKPQNHLSAISAPRDQIYIRNQTGVPELIPQAAVNDPLFLNNRPQLQAEAIARIAAERWISTNASPAPLYVRPANAAPSTDLPPVLLDK